MWALAVSAGLAAPLAGSRPTEVAVLDVVLTAVTATVLVWSVAQARRWTWALVGVPAAAIGGWGPALLGLTSMGLAVVGIRRRRSDPVLGALVGAAGAAGAFWLPTASYPLGVPTLAATAAFAPAVISMLRRLPPRRRRIVVRAVEVAGGATLLVVAVTGYAAIDATTDATDAVAASRAAVSALREGDRRASARKFAEAAAAFDAAGDRLATPWASAARGVPVVGQHVAAVRSLSGTGAQLARSAGAAVDDLDFEALEAGAGRVDLDGVRALEAPAAEVVRATAVAEDEVARVDSPWLIAPLRARIDDLRADLTAAVPSARRTLDAVRVAPWLLGADGARRYLVLFTAPAESREAGGFVGAYGFLTADRGNLDFDGRGSVAELNFALLDRPRDPDIDRLAPTIAYRAQTPARYPQAWTGTPDFPTVARVAAASIGQVEAEPVDGVMLVDPYTLAALLDFTGPIVVPEVDVRLTPTNAVDYLLREQYLRFAADEQGERKELLNEVGNATFDSFIAGDLPSPTVLADRLAPLVGDRRLLFSVDEPAVRALLDDTGLSGRLEPTRGGLTVTAVTTNVRANKLDAYVNRSVRLDGTTAGGVFRGTMTIELRNNVHAAELPDFVTGDGPPVLDGLPEGTHRIDLAVYTSARVERVLVGGEERNAATEPAYGMQRYSTIVEIPEGDTVRVELRLEQASPAGPPDVRWIPFAAANPDELGGELGKGGN